VEDQGEVVLRTGPLLPRGFHLVLDLDDVLAEDEADVHRALISLGGEATLSHFDDEPLLSSLGHPDILVSLEVKALLEIGGNPQNHPAAAA